MSLDDESARALADLADRTDASQSEVVRRAVTFYATNFDAADGAADARLDAYHRMLSTGEHVLLDVDFLHCFLDYVEGAAGDPDPDFLDAVDRVAAYHAREYGERFATLGDLLHWLDFCGFLAVRDADGPTYHVVFPTASVKWFMLRFVERSARDLPFDIEVEGGVSKAIITTVDA
ncbi:hypothetical protein MBEHAL_1763 [Halarchaeum acidiphilum MH1-52-1]|uniref:Ribbon-helix-helix protein CopG domain-containing protein n=1 Tax=Halarchaeum acidiphilum MH1-52-1 TaxID=1261545 RepID=U3AE05_9EURY|nr:hypothetical protein MBEHAL_1763 [Halarchaeum acidiphilum MH1-52-1]